MVLQAEKRAARVAVLPRQPYLVVDFMVKELLRAWIARGMVGGRFLLAGEAGLANGSAGSSTLSALGQALRAATAVPRFFRLIEQWT